MELKRLSKQLLISGTLLIWTIKLVLRPLNYFDEPSRFFLGIAPNLFGSFLIPFGAYWLFSGKNHLIARIFQLRNSYDLRLVCFLGIGMLIVNEFLQLVPFFGRTFDPYDILFSVAGLLCSYMVFSRLRQRYSIQ